MSEKTFAGLGVSNAVCTALNERGFTAPFAIQSQVIGDVLAGRDVLALGAYCCCCCCCGRDWASPGDSATGCAGNTPPPAIGSSTCRPGVGRHSSPPATRRISTAGCTWESAGPRNTPRWGWTSS